MTMKYINTPTSFVLQHDPAAYAAMVEQLAKDGFLTHHHNDLAKNNGYTIKHGRLYGPKGNRVYPRQEA